MKAERGDNLSTSRKRQRQSCTDYKVACLVPLGIELAPLRAMLDEIHDDLATSRDQNAYILGAIARHNVVIATLPSVGNNDSGVVANQLLNDFPSVRFGLLVGIAGGIPGTEGQNDIRLGDVVVSVPDGMAGGVIQFDKGKRNGDNSFVVTGHLNKPTAFLRATVNKLKARHLHEGNQLDSLVTDMLCRNPGMQDQFTCPGLDNDHLYKSDYVHIGGNTCKDCDLGKTIDRPKRSDSSVKIHYGTIGSSNAVIKNALDRDRLGHEHNLLAVEMEAAGIMDTLPCLVIRGICDYADSHKNKDWQPYASATAAAYAREFLNVVPVDNETASSQTATSHAPVSARTRDSGRIKKESDTEDDTSKAKLDALLKSLSFDSMGDRIRNVAEALPRTCDWLFDHDHFKTWALRQQVVEHNGFLWMKGKPGSGKSTLMKIAFRWTAKKWSREVNVSYFFNARATSELDKSSLGFYRALSHNILRAYPQLQDAFLERFKLKEKDNTVAIWTILELRGFLSEAIQTLQGQPLNIFVDALDEGDEDDVRQLVSFLEDLSLSMSSSSLSLRICLSSRHYPHISVKSGLSLVVEDQQGHKDDLKYYINTKLVFAKSVAMEKLQEQIYEKSAGIFLWLVLVIPILNKAYDRGRSISDMHKCLKDIPEKLDDLFTQILDQSTEDITECLSLLQWTLYAKTALSPMELDLAVYSSTKTSRRHEQRSAESLERHILNTSRGLVEVTKSESPVVQFIHETVREFLKARGLAHLDPSLEHNIEGWSHEKLKSGCILYLNLYSTALPAVTPETRRADTASSMKIWPLMRYAINHVFDHADIAESCGISQQTFIEWLRGNNSRKLHAWINGRNALQKFRVRRYTNHATLLYICVEQNLENLVELLIRNGAKVNTQGERFGSVLQAAAAAGLESMTERLINAGAKVNIEGGEFGHALCAALHFKRDDVAQLLISKQAMPNAALIRSTFFSTIARGHLFGVELLLNLGADINFVYPRGETPLILAVHKKHLDIAKVLVNRGAELDTVCKMHGTALQLACRRRYVDTIRILLEHGADPDVGWSSTWYRSSMIEACSGTLLAIPLLFLDYWPTKNTRDQDVVGSLHAACKNGYAEVVRTVLDRSPRYTNMPYYYPDGYRDYLLHCACEYGFAEIVATLITHGADLSAQNQDLDTPFSIARRKRNSVVENLLRCRAG